MTSKEAIVKKALPFFLTYGYDGMSMNQLLEYLEMSKGRFYHHFSNKEELAIMVAESMYVNQFELIVNICNGTDTLYDKLSKIRDIVSEYLFAYDQTQFLNSYIFMFQMKLKSSDINDRIKDNYSNLYESTTFMLSQAVNSKEISYSIDVESQALILLALIEGLLMLSSSMTKAISDNIKNLFESYHNGLKESL